jgi:hypothetical protein
LASLGHWASLGHLAFLGHSASLEHSVSPGHLASLEHSALKLAGSGLDSMLVQRVAAKVVDLQVLVVLVPERMAEEQLVGGAVAVRVGRKQIVPGRRLEQVDGLLASVVLVAFVVLLATGALVVMEPDQPGRVEVHK